MLPRTLIGLRELITLGTLDNTVQDEDIAICLGFKDEYILEERLLVVKNLLDPNAVSLHRLIGGG